MAKVVLVEDEPEIRDMVADELAHHGHVVITAPDGEKGLAAILEHRPNVVCCDINMPVMNGLALKQRLNERGIGPGDLTFIFVTALAGRTDVADGLMIGADHYLTKPIDFDRLVSIVAG